MKVLKNWILKCLKEERTDFMNISLEELEKERDYLIKTLSVINSIIDESDESIRDKMNSITEMKRYIWENSGTLDEVEIADGMYNVNVDVEHTNNSINSLQKLRRSLINPYFGRIDFEKDEDIDQIYIGINGIMKDLNFYVFDWRTPIASMFYNYGIGPASYEAPVGSIEGNITLKRQYKIQNGNIERCFNSTLNIDDEYLQEILSKSSSDKMSNIVNTIQREQNEIIRNIVDKYLIVQGIAGSGKTSVALHRIAYLLYKEKNLTSNNVLIFSPNDVFSEYISQVLPELGEDNVLQTTYSDFSKSYIKDFKEIESFTNFIERFYKNNDIDEEKYRVIQFKLSDQFKRLLDKSLCDYKNSIFFTRGISINSTEIDVNELNSLFNSRYGSKPIDDRLEYMSEYICDSANISYKKYGKTIQNKLREYLNKNLSIKDLYSKILMSEDFKNQSGVFKDADVSAGKVLKYEDLISMLYLNFELNGYPSGRNIRHIIIDEAQDYTLLQLSMLKRIFNTASFTILGDINQTINPYYKYEDFNQVNSIFDEKARYIELLKTYRSSEEIIKYTNDILGLNNACSVRKSNEIPVALREVDDTDVIIQLITDISEMKKSGMERIAIITRNNNETLDLYDKLKDKIEDISLVENNKKGGINNTVIMPSYISKGLEFDGVIAYSSKENEYTEKDKHLFYVVCTRAQHSLSVYNGPTLTLKRNNGYAK